MLICKVLTPVSYVIWEDFGIVPIDEPLEEICIPYSEIKYIISSGENTKIHLKDGTYWISTIETKFAFLLFCDWIKRNPLT